MTRQQHHIRQMKWFEELNRYGKVQIEPSIRIHNAEIFPDVYAEIDDKKHVIEIGDVDDSARARKAYYRNMQKLRNNRESE